MYIYFILNLNSLHILDLLLLYIMYLSVEFFYLSVHYFELLYENGGIYMSI